jgi:hypothetical protein
MPRRKYTFNHINNIQLKDIPSKENTNTIYQKKRTTMTSFRNVNTNITDRSSLEGTAVLPHFNTP